MRQTRSRTLLEERPGTSYRKRRVLLVDDNADTRYLLAAILTDWDIEAVSAESAAQALSSLAQDGAFDLVISDVLMFPVDGLTLYKRIHEAWPSLPVIISTGDSDAARMARELGANVVSKPIELAALHGMVEKSLNVEPRSVPQQG